MAGERGGAGVAVNNEKGEEALPKQHSRPGSARFLADLESGSADHPFRESDSHRAKRLATCWGRLKQIYLLRRTRHTQRQPQ